MTIEESRRSQRPYRYGMVLLCVGALINWLGLAEHYVEPVRYVGVACIVAGALLICAAMCCWLHAPPLRTSSQTQRTTHPITAQIDDPIHVISVEEPSSGSRQKPPDYEAVADAPPSYDDAIKLNPGQLARSNHRNSVSATSVDRVIPSALGNVIVGTSLSLAESARSNHRNSVSIASVERGIPSALGNVIVGTTASLAESARSNHRNNVSTASVERGIPSALGNVIVGTSLALVEPTALTPPPPYAR